MKSTILVTGATGFVGHSLLPALELAFPDAKILGIRHRITAQDSNNNYACDLSDSSAVEELISELAPDYIVNLAAISHIPTAFENPGLTWSVNLQGVLNLLNALAKQPKHCTFLQIGSGDCYGQTFANNHNVVEENPFCPLNPYSASKAAADIASYSFIRHSQLKIIRARPFNHSGPRQSADFVICSFAQQIAKIEAGLQPPTITVGNLDAQRCFLHIDDVINAYILLLKNAVDIPSGAAFNIAAENPVSISEILTQLLAKSKVKITVEIDPNKQRPTDIPIAKGDSQYLKSITNWEESISLDQLLAEVLDAQREKYPVS
jgi:GDP-4-dehydro-6-deoxy-D-mannose reductase